MKLTFDNLWVTFYARSMGKIIEVKEISLNDEQDKKVTSKGLFSVTVLEQNDVTITLHSDPYSKTYKSSNLEDLSTDENPYLNLYFEADGVFYQVSHIVTSAEEANRITMERDDVAVICADDYGFHYLASFKSLNLNEPL